MGEKILLTTNSVVMSGKIPVTSLYHVQYIRVTELCACLHFHGGGGRKKIKVSVMYK
jgi:hypothetical protein